MMLHFVLFLDLTYFFNSFLYSTLKSCFTFPYKNFFFVNLTHHDNDVHFIGKIYDNTTMIFFLSY